MFGSITSSQSSHASSLGQKTSPIISYLSSVPSLLGTGQKSPKIAPYKDVFVHYQGLEGDSQVLNTCILIVLIQLRVVGIRMLSKGQHLAVFPPNMSATRPHIAISEHLLIAHNR